MDRYLENKVNIKCLEQKISNLGARETLEKWRDCADNIREEKTKGIEHLYNEFSNFSDVKLLENNFNRVISFIKALLEKLNDDEKKEMLNTMAENCLINEKYHNCPICDKKLKYSIRYPHYICSACKAKAVDENGNSLSFYNIDMGGGFFAEYTETNEKRNSHICFINRVKCIADEARFGGIVLQPYSSFSRKALKYYTDSSKNNE